MDTFRKVFKNNFEKKKNCEQFLNIIFVYFKSKILFENFNMKIFFSIHFLWNYYIFIYHVRIPKTFFIFLAVFWKPNRIEMFLIGLIIGWSPFRFDLTFWTGHPLSQPWSTGAGNWIDELAKSNGSSWIE